MKPGAVLKERGAQALSTSDLMAILVGSGDRYRSAEEIAANLLARRGAERPKGSSPSWLIAGLNRADPADLQEFEGIGERTAIRIIAAAELGVRVSRATVSQRRTISTPEDIRDACIDMASQTRETLRVLCVSTKNNLTRDTLVYQGNVSSALVRVSEVLRPAIRSNSPGFIMVHNHPSGDPNASPGDVLITRKVNRAAELVDIELVDHVIIAQGGSFTSMKSRGLGFGPGG